MAPVELGAVDESDGDVEVDSEIEVAELLAKLLPDEDSRDRDGCCVEAMGIDLLVVDESEPDVESVKD